MASFLQRLFRRRDPVPEQAKRPPLMINPVAIPVPPDYPPDLLVRVPERQARPVHRKGKRRTPEEIAADREAPAAGMRSHGAQHFSFDRTRAEAIGVTHYIWRSAGDADTCRACAENNGKRFAYAVAPATGHPGCVDICDNGYCRCLAEPVIPDHPRTSR